ncbi:DUF2510 domain-containing protein [Leifsonia poae]|uniref:DUF2510 domain-containing protein n=1 Tax=Leifsonia poae TaxID=110933 RepID=UPI001CC0664F|nr:DUF2510 domain-containing protein [Leifsonia poae]
MAEAGWYPDPGVTGRARYWDGSQWTERVSVVQTPVETEVVPFAPPAYATDPTPGLDAAASPKNTKATVALVLGAVSLLINPFCALSILAIVNGVSARSQAARLRAAGYPPAGGVAAAWGIALGVIGTIGFVVIVANSFNQFN